VSLRENDGEVASERCSVGGQREGRRRVKILQKKAKAWGEGGTNDENFGEETIQPNKRQTKQNETEKKRTCSCFMTEWYTEPTKGR